MLIKKIVSIFTSLKLTVTLLAFCIALVFVGTLAQADEGLYGAQAHYFNQWIVVGAQLFGYHVPLLLPGGYLLGVLLLANLICAHIHRFQFTTKKIGIQLAHSGVIVLLVGQLATTMWSRELQMHFYEGEKRNYSESTLKRELVFRTKDEVTAIPQNLLKPGNDLAVANLPFSIRVINNWRNSTAVFRPPMMQNSPPLTTNGIGTKFNFVPIAEAKTMDDLNIPTAVFELVTPAGSLGKWVATDDAMAGRVYNDAKKMFGEEMADKVSSLLLLPQIITAAGREFLFEFQPEREIHPFSLTLLKATHTVYPGTITSMNPEGIPKDFRSRVRIDNSQTGENREVEISMNHPLRYGGYTFYQYQMSAGEMVERAGQRPSSALQVVRNPSWLTPYIGCALVGLGLVIQFLKHLVGFISKRKAK